MIYEQAALCFLQAGLERKFCFYIAQAGIIYEDLKNLNYSYFCFGLIEPYYSKVKWNEIRKYMYKVLGSNTFYLGNFKLSVKFFKSLLQLCCDIDDPKSQVNVLNEFLNVVVQRWNVI